jgi:hypothetical protein
MNWLRPEKPAGGDLRQGKIGSCLQEFLGSFDAAQEDIVLLINEEPWAQSRVI